MTQYLAAVAELPAFAEKVRSALKSTLFQAADPMAGISRESAAMLLGGDYEFTEPDDVAELADGADLVVIGRPITGAADPAAAAASIGASL